MNLFRNLGCPLGVEGGCLQSMGVGVTICRVEDATGNRVRGFLGVKNGFGKSLSTITVQGP